MSEAFEQYFALYTLPDIKCMKKDDHDSQLGKRDNNNPSNPTKHSYDNQRSSARRKSKRRVLVAVLLVFPPRRDEQQNMPTPTTDLTGQRSPHNCALINYMVKEQPTHRRPILQATIYYTNTHQCNVSLSSCPSFPHIMYWNFNFYRMYSQVIAISFI